MDLLLDGGATARLTRLVVTDDFPPVQRVRFAVLQRWPEDSWQVELLTCPWCVSAYIGLGVVAARRLFPQGWSPVAKALTFSLVAGLVAERA